MQVPCVANDWQAEHAALLLRSHLELTGRALIPESPNQARELFEAPIFVASHHRSEDPVLSYGNQTALELFEMSWDEFTTTPSRFTAEAPHREEREALLQAVNSKGYIDDYSGIRISKSGQRFKIERATVWNLIGPDGTIVGQAASFDSWQPIV